MSTSSKTPVTKRLFKQCGFCGIWDKHDERLMKCSGCNITFYCSRECQKNDWREHKLRCLINRNSDRLAEERIAPKLHINGLNFKEIDKRFRKWQGATQGLLVFHGIHALNLQSDITRIFTHMFLVTVVPNPETMSATAPKAATPADVVKYFRIDDAEVQAISDVMTTCMDYGVACDVLSSVEKSRLMNGVGECPGIILMMVILKPWNLHHLISVIVKLRIGSPNERLTEWKLGLKLLVEEGAVLEGQ